MDKLKILTNLVVANKQALINGAIIGAGTFAGLFAANTLLKKTSTTTVLVDGDIIVDVPDAQ